MQNLERLIGVRLIKIRLIIVKSHQESVETLINLLNRSDATFEEKKYWNSELFKQLKEFREYDKENKNFLREIDNKNKEFLSDLYRGVVTCAVCLIALFATLCRRKD
ncbi:MAG: hypothetical protein LBR54_01005 [Oscillospiraceae bacterium]|nr:hypothetical protein [Oscillospiraceae bacterium]